jgi:hypothetical protein
MATTDTVNEGSTAYVTATFRDKAGTLALPTGVSYRIDCVSNGQEVRDDTSATPATAVEITLSPADNAIIDPKRPRELRRVTVTGTYGDNDAVIEQYDYWVRNLSHVS